MNKLELRAYENRDGSRHVRIEGDVELPSTVVGSPSLQSEPHSSGMRSTRVRFWKGDGISMISVPDRELIIYACPGYSEQALTLYAQDILEMFSYGLEKDLFTFPLGRAASEEIARKVIAEVRDNLPS